MKEKLIDLSEAISSLVKDGDSVQLGSGLETAIPFAATFELIRQKRRNLHMISPISDASTDMLIGGGCVTEVSASWVGNVSGGLGHNYRRAVEKGEPHPIKINDYSNLSLAMALFAGAYGLPYVPVKSILGSDILKSNPALKPAENPFAEESEPLVLVPALQPDVSIQAVQRADRFGNNHYWGSSGVAKEAALAAEKVILIAHEIVEPEVIATDPSRVLVPGFRVDAVCHVPGGTHPAPLTGYLKRDSDFFNDYHKGSRDPEHYAEWAEDWIFSTGGHAGYREKLGDRLEKLRIKGEQLAAPVNYAFE